MAIRLNKLELENFKGIRNLLIEFGQETTIYGDNGVGKTTIVDAFTWLLWGKNSDGKTTFDLRPLDENNNPIHMVECSVTGELDKNGVVVKFKRISKEKWETKKGSPEPEFRGNEIVYEVNDVSCKQVDFKSKVDSLIEENIFKILTSPFYFNTMPWQDRRGILMNIVGGITNDEIAGDNKDYRDLLARIAAAGTDMVEFKKSIASRKKKIKQRLDEIPPRIDENMGFLPDELNYSEIEAEIEAKRTRIMDIDTLIASDARNTVESNKSINDNILKLQNEIFASKSRIQEIENAKKTEEEKDRRDKSNAIVKVEKELSTCKELIKTDTDEINRLVAEVEKKKTEKAELVKRWQVVNSEKFEFNPDLCSCPLCKRKFEGEDLEKKREELRVNFTDDKVKRLKIIEEPGNRLKEEIVSNEQKISDLKFELKSFENNIPDLEAALKTAQEEAMQIKHFVTRVHADNEWKALTKEIEDKKVQIEKLKSSLINGGDLSEVKKEKAELESLISELEMKLQTKRQREDILSRIEDLKKEQRDKSQAIADLEKEEFVIESFLKSKMTTLEEKVNSLFSGVRFKMFNQQINGGEEPCCICLVDGVPFSGANTAGQVNAGIECINVISKFYNESAPIFIDGRESIVRLIPTESQIVNLVVSAVDKELRIVK